MNIMMKPHQAVSSGPKLRLFNVHRDTDMGGLALALDTMLKECQLSMLRAGKMDVNDVDEFEQFSLTFRQQKKGPNRSEEDKKLSLNNLENYRLYGCAVAEVEMSDEGFEKVRPLVRHAIDAKLVERYLGRNACVLIVGGGVLTPTERNYQQRLKRVHVMYVNNLVYEDLPNVVNLYKPVRGYTEDDSEPQHKNVTLIKEMMDMTLEVEKDGEKWQEPLFRVCKW